MSRSLGHLLVGAVAAVLLVTVSTSDGAPLAQHAPSLDWSLRRADRDPDAVPTGLGDFPEGEFTDAEPGPLDRALGIGIGGLLFTVLAVAGAYAIRETWRRRPQLVWRRPEDVDFDVLADFATSVSGDADEQRRVLETGRTRNAIVACWARLERLVARTGTAIDPAETAEELTRRVLSQYEIEPSAIEELASLYREARFSRHEMGEPERAAAIAALDRVHTGLRRHPDRAGASR